jgi:hypothetical protein
MKSHPRNAIEKGLTSQLMTSVTPMPRHWLLTCASAPKSILISIGMIVTRRGDRCTGRALSAGWKNPAFAASEPELS